MYYERHELENGLRVLAAPMPGMHSATTAMFVGVGSRHEDERHAGVAHFIEHMLFKGTTRHPSARAIAETIERSGGMLNASTDKEATVYWAKTAKAEVDLALDLLADMLQFSRFRPADIVKEKAVIVEELNMTVDDPQDWVHALIDEVLWQGHPLGRDVAGTPTSVAGLTRRQVIGFLTDHYGATNAVLVVAGGVTPAQVFDAAAHYFGDWPAVQSPAPLPIGQLPPAWAPRLELRKTEQVNLCLAYPGLSRNHPDHYALDLLATILGGSMSSRLFTEVRERLALAYDVHAYTNKMGDTGSFVIYAGVDPRRGTAALEAILREVDRLQRRPVSRSELDRTREYCKGRMYLGLEDTHAVASWLGFQELLLGDIMSPEQVIDQIERVTPRALQRLARDLLNRTEARLAVIGPNGPDLLPALAA